MIEGADPGVPVSGPGPAAERRMRRRCSPQGAQAHRPGGAAAPALDARRPAESGYGGGRRQAGNQGTRWRGRGRYEHRPFYAALDLGTNNCRLLVAEPSHEGSAVVDCVRAHRAPGRGRAGQTGNLNEEAMERAIAALRVCSQKLGATGRWPGWGSSPPRPAAAPGNGAAFLSRVHDELGLELEIIDRRTERAWQRRAVSRCSTRSPRAPSSGISAADRPRSSGSIAESPPPRSRTGLDVLAGRYGDFSPSATAGSRSACPPSRRWSRKCRPSSTCLRPRRLAQGRRGRRFHLLGTSGTVTTLAGVHLDLPRYDRRRVDGLWMESADVERDDDENPRHGLRARRNNACIGRERADLVLAGCAIFEAIRSEWPCSRLRVADRGLREGILVQLMRADGHLRKPDRANQPGARRP